MDLALQFMKEFWLVLGEMAPYLLLGFLISGVLSVVISPETVERHLGGGGILPVLKASLFGIPLPLCSCGVIPIAASLRKHGAGNGATIAFLISTPETGVDSILATYSLMGLVFAVFRPICALVSGVLGGLLVNLVAMKEGGDVPEGLKCDAECCSGGPRGNPIMSILRYGFLTLPRDIGRALLFGIVVAALISVFVPKDFFAEYLGSSFLVMIVMMLIGIPMYVCATASIPIALALIAQAGVTPGAAFVFLVTGPATNAATLATVWKLMGRRTAVVYLLSVALTALAGGILLDALFTVLNLPLPTMPEDFHEEAGWVIFNNASAILLLAVLFFAAIHRSLGHLAPESVRELAEHAHDHEHETVVLKIGGMTCDHCREHAEKTLADLPGVESVEVDLAHGRAKVYGHGLQTDDLIKSVESAGFTASVAQA